MTLSVLSVASEAVPFIKTGGLADVVGALPSAVAPHGVAMTTLLPAYSKVLAGAGKTKVVHRWDSLLGSPARLLASSIDGHPLLLLDAPSLFARDGGPYSGPEGKDWADNWLRFAALSRAAADVASGAVKGRAYDVLHAHDWQTALAPAYLRFVPGPGRAARSIVTIHNIAFQGHYGADIFPTLGLPPSAWGIDGVEYHGGVGYLKAGMAAADAITTVSPSYATEIATAEFGMGLEGLVQARSGVVTGIVNGIDPAVWSPASDDNLASNFTSRSVSKRSINKRAIEAAFGLEAGDGPLFIVVSRLTWQKGMDLLLEAADHLVGLGARLAVLGTGDAALEDGFRAAAARHPGRIGVRIGYDEALSHLMQGGGDAILIPSRFEPCGLTQLYGLAYGCVPVVARTGGLADTVIDANVAALSAGVATGVQHGPGADALRHAIARAVALFAEPAIWRRIQQRGMAADFSWGRSGKAYADLYARLAGQT